MSSNLRVGSEAVITFQVESRHAIDFANGEMPAVLSTPWLIWFMEHAARKAVLPYLKPGESTVGTRVEVEHQAPTPLGQTVTCKARVLFVDLPSVTFRLEAFDEMERIAHGTHKLSVINQERFRRRVERKLSGSA